ncbi:Signal transduction histidine-protein kinase BarA [invertebrate metagenome]|uniref:histidine kinase n=1 Tax=invertebrate metagenome TaxID=1711999 RepID=A0A2H9TB52_9ZZZZ
MDSTPRKNCRKLSLAMILFGWFMVLSVGPLTVIGFIEYQEGREAIIKSRFNELSRLNIYLTEEILDSYQNVAHHVTEVIPLAEQLISQMQNGIQSSEDTPAAFVESFEYHLLIEDYFDEFFHLVNFDKYEDVIIGDDEGNVLFTVKSRDDLGKNLLNHALLAETRLAEKLGEVLASAEPRYASAGSYPPANNKDISFFIFPLKNYDKQPVGFIAAALNVNYLSRIFEHADRASESDKTVSYIVGRQGGIHSNKIALFKNRQAVKKTELFRQWERYLDEDSGEYIEEELDNHSIFYVPGYSGHGGERSDHDHASTVSEGTVRNSENEYDPEDGHDHASSLMSSSTDKSAHISRYQGMMGSPVLGTYHHLNLAGTPLAVISEIDEDVAFARVYEFRIRILYIVILTLILVMVIAALVTRSIVKPVRTITSWVRRVSAGDYVHSTVLTGNREIYELSSCFADMTNTLRQVSNDNERRQWLQAGQAGLNDCILGQQELSRFCNNIVNYLCRYLGVEMGALYVFHQDDGRLHRMGTYAWYADKPQPLSFGLGEGMVGQAGQDKQRICVRELSGSALRITSGAGKSVPVSITEVPLVFKDELKGVIELVMVRELTHEQSDFLDHALENIAISLNSVQYRTRADALLEKTTQQSAVLQEQQEELKAVNDELEKRAMILEESREELKAQSEKLQVSNHDLEEKSQQLTLQTEEIQRQNIDIESSRQALEEKAKELEQASKYKSEFLANMSHELRTPLNSLLLLSQMLGDNDEENLTEDQLESIQVIHKGGEELLMLINDILDLSKVEAGKMTVTLEEMVIEELAQNIRDLFNPLAGNKGLDFIVDIHGNVPVSILSDSQRVMQILKNFLSNAFKFTHEGEIAVIVSSVDRPSKFGTQRYIAFAVKDSGIGIPKEKQPLVFEAFRQADGSTSRQYGGTGLGLAISREFSALLGGFVEVESEEGRGTTFTLLLPQGQKCTLVPDVDAQTDDQPETKNITEHQVTAKNDSDIPSPSGAGTPEKADSVSQVPCSGVADVLACFSHKKRQQEIQSLLKANGEAVHFVDSVNAVRETLKTTQYACVVMDSVDEGFNFLTESQNEELQPTVVIYTESLPDEQQYKSLQAFDCTVVMQEEGGEKRLLQEIQRSVKAAKEPETSHDNEDYVSEAVDPDIKAALAGHRILLVDDDLRNVFALSRVLQEADMDVVIADNGRTALEKLKEDEDIELVLMDIMMPVMDGYEAIEKIRALPSFSTLPIIAVTAKSMSENREKCLAVGADDYLAKPIIINRLMALMHRWLTR